MFVVGGKFDQVASVVCIVHVCIGFSKNTILYIKLIPVCVQFMCLTHNRSVSSQIIRVIF